MIYLDNASTTQPLPEVVDVMLPFLREHFGNPSSLHSAGTTVRQKVEEARADIARILGADSTSQIVFTSGATESIATAFASITRETAQIVLTAVEHSAVLSAAKRWANGRSVITIPVNAQGDLDMERLRVVIGQAPSFVSIMLANNETGVLFNAVGVSEMCRREGAVLHVDAAQALGKVPVNLQEINCDYLSLSAHKFHGPKGSGALYARRPTQLQPIFPGHQELHRRAGTENVSGIMGLAAAARAIPDCLSHVGVIAEMRDQLENLVTASIEGALINGHTAQRVASISNISLPHISAADFVVQLSRRGLCSSSGAACSSGRQPSHVIRAMSNDTLRAEASLRFSLSRFTNRQEIEEAARVVSETYHNAALPQFDTPASA